MRTRKHAVARRSLGNERGLALIITLFVVALVAVLVLEYHFDASVELDLAANYANDVQAYHLALAGVRFAQAVLQQDDPTADGPDDVWYKLGLLPACFAPQQLLALAALGAGEGPDAGGPDAKSAALTDRLLADASAGDGGCVRLRITDEDSKLPINGLMPQPPTATGGAPTPPPTNPWVQIFKTFFARFLQADPETVEALIDWIDTDDIPSGAGGAERSYYEHLPVPYKPPDKPMRTLGELRLVKGLENPEELAKLFPGATPEALADLDLGSNAYLTTAWGDNLRPWDAAKVNVNTALPEVLEILFEGLGLAGGTGGGGVKAQVQQIVEQRQEKQLTSLPNVVTDLAKVADIKSSYFRVESIGVVGNVNKKIVAVLKRAPSAVARLPRGTLPRRTSQPTQPMTMLYFKVE